MNLRRNLFQLWIVGSALFMLTVAIVSYSEIKKEFEDAAASVTDRAAFGTLEPVTDKALIRQTPNPWASVGTVAGIAFGFPLVALALGASLVWALSGFAVRAAERPE